jgi:hypothetical protein
VTLSRTETETKIYLRSSAVNQWQLFLHADIFRLLTGYRSESFHKKTKPSPLICADKRRSETLQCKSFLQPPESNLSYCYQINLHPRKSAVRFLGFTPASFSPAGGQ